MARDYFIAGEVMAYVKGRAGTGIANLTELGLSSEQVRLTFSFKNKGIAVDAWGGELGPPAEIQVFLASVQIQLILVHFDPAVLDICMQESLGGTSAPGRMARAGARMCNNSVRFSATNHFISLNLASPVGNKPWRFYHAYLSEPPVAWPLGTERSAVTTNWTAIPQATDPWNGGLGAFDAILWDNILDN